jgi:hypothetical protein
MNIAAGMTALKAGADLTRSLRDGPKAGTIKGDEIAGRIGEIYDYIVDSKDALVDAKDEIENLKTELKAAKDITDLVTRLDFDGHVYWLRTADKWDGPFCPVCWNGTRQLVRLEHGRANRDPALASFDCNIHCRLFTTKLRPNAIVPFTARP